MNMFFELLHATQGDLAIRIATQTAGALLAGLWQGVLLSVAAGILLRVAPRSTAATRFVVWAAVFCTAVAMPFIDLPHAAFSGRLSGPAGSHLVFDPRWSYVLSAFWLAASLYRMAQLGLQAAELRTLWKSAVPVAADRFGNLGSALEVSGRNVELCTSYEVDRPSVIGFLAPRILIPNWLFEQLTAVELNHIVLHEMEHLRRRDDWVNLLQKVGLVLLPLNPALFWIDRRLSTERELACDDGVLEQTQMPRAYAASLASVAERRLVAHRRLRVGMLALAATGLRRRSELGRRIESILGMRGPVNRGLATALAVVLVVAVIGSAAGLARAPQLVSFGRNAAVPQVALKARGIEPLAVGRRVAGYQNVSFHEPAKARILKARAVAVNPVRVAKAVPVAAKMISTGESVAPARRQFVVLTSWDGDQPVTRVAVAMPDGKFVFVPYAALPTEAGWLIVQL